MICRLFTDGTIKYINNAFADYFVKNNEEISGRSFVSLINKEEQDSIRRIINSLNTKNPAVIHNCRLQTKGGNVSWLQLIIQGMFDKKNNLLELQLVGQDITYRKEANEELQESEERYRSLVKNIPDAVWTTDERYRIVFVGPNIKSVLGYSQEEIYKSGSWLVWFQRVHPKDVDRAKAAFRALVEQGKEYKIEYRFKRKDGRWGWLLDRSVGTYERDGIKYADGLFSDITERKKAENKIHKFQQRLQSLASQISLTEEQERRRIAICLHDQISQTLALVRMKLAALQHSSSNNYNEQITNILQLVEQAINRTRSLTFDLAPPILYELGLEAALEWLAEQFQEQYNITIRFHDDGKYKPIEDDCRSVLFFAVRELLVNIIKHARARSASISIQNLDGKIHILVQDDGIGFNAYQIERQRNVFGLFSIRERLRNIGGHLKLDSRPGSGTRVSLITPLGSKIYNHMKS